MEGFFGADLKYDLAIQLAALHIHQKATEAAQGKTVKISVRNIEKEFEGLDKFVPADLLNSVRGKDLRKILEQQIKQNESLASPGQKHINSLQCKIHYLNLASQIFSYGAKYFDVIRVVGKEDGPTFTKVKCHVTLIVCVCVCVCATSFQLLLRRQLTSAFICGQSPF